MYKLIHFGTFLESSLWSSLESWIYCLEMLYKCDKWHILTAIEDFSLLYWCFCCVPFTVKQHSETPQQLALAQAREWELPDNDGGKDFLFQVESSWFKVLVKQHLSKKVGGWRGNKKINRSQTDLLQNNSCVLAVCLFLSFASAFLLFLASQSFFLHVCHPTLIPRSLVFPMFV